MAISYRLVRPAAGDQCVLSEAQERVAAHHKGALLVLGGVRTGKTTALIRAAVARLEAGAPQVLFITGSRASRLDVRARVGSGYPHLASRFNVTTFYSFAQWVVQRFGDPAETPSVLTAARQDTYIRQILAGQPTDAWPRRFANARTTAKFAADVREAVASCQRAGLSPADVIDQGMRAGHEQWVCLGRFYREYLDILGMAGVLDYPEFLIRARRLLHDPDVLDEVRPPGSLVVVDQVEDIDPAQEEIVNSLVDVGSTIILAANPDCQVYGFRGAKPRSVGEMLNGWEQQGVATGVVCLSQGHDVVGEIEAGCADLKRRIPLPMGVGVEDLAAYRRLDPDRSGRVGKVLFKDTDAEADHIAHILLRAHVGESMAYEDMAVLVRKQGSFTRYAAACSALGVPVAISGDEIQLNQETIVDVLLSCLRVVRDGDGCSQTDLRKVSDWLGEGTDQVSAVLTAGAEKMGGSAAEVLWAVWQASGWQARLLGDIDAGEGVLVANRALDAVVALFSLASTLTDMAADKGISALDEAVASQEVPENLPRSSSWASSAVRLTTAHRAKGRCWPLVIVAGIEEGNWPPRSSHLSMLDVEELSASLSPARDKENLSAERRLLYAACSSCSDQLILTAVDDQGKIPSVLFDRVVAPTEIVEAGVRAPSLTPAGLVGMLRTVVSDDSAHPGLRQAASDRLARLCADPHFYGAHPSRWWGAHAGSIPDGSGMRSAGGVVTLSASQVESLFSCPRRWYLARKAQAEGPVTARTRIGSVIHSLVQDPGASLEDMIHGLEQAWDQMEFPAAWMTTTEMDEAVKALGRFDSYRRATGRTVLASEIGVDVELDSAGPVRIQGRIDRIEQDSSGGIWIVDLKTGKNPPSPMEARANIQLGLYQLAVGMNAVPGMSADSCVGAELVYLRSEAAKGSSFPKVLTQAGLGDTPHLEKEPRLPILTGEIAEEVADQWQYPTWVHHRIALAAALIRQGTYPALSSKSCQFCSFRHGCPVVTSRGGRR